MDSSLQQTDLWSRNEIESPLLQLPVEIRLRVYELVIGSRVIHVSMRWSRGSACSSGFNYSCLGNSQPLVIAYESFRIQATVPSDSNITILSQICRQMYKETASLPFKTFIWMFEHAFALDQFLSVDHHVRAEHKRSIRTIALPIPGPYRSSEEILVDLQTTILFGGFGSDTIQFTKQASIPIPYGSVVLELKKETSTNMWMMGTKRAEYTKDLFP